MTNQYSDWERAAMWKQTINRIRDACDDQREIIDEIVCETRAKISAGKPVECPLCWDTGFMDVLGEVRCRNKCPIR